MIDINTAKSSIQERLERLPMGHCLEIRTYKRNRRVLFQRDGEGTWRAFQDGFDRQVYEDVSRDKLRKLIQNLLRKEFPRSSKIRIYALGPCQPDHESRLPRKVL
jgi:hypothetical protein